MRVTETITATGEWKLHWPVVVAAMAGASLSSLHLYSTGVMIPALEQQFGWSRAEITAGPAIVSLVGLALAPFIGIAIDRLGARRIGLVGAMLFLGSMALLATVNGQIWTWWACWLLLAIAASFISPTVWTAGVSSLFSRARGMALALTLCGTGLGAFFVPIIANRLLSDLGWRATYPALAGIWALIVLPLLFLAFTSRNDQRRTGAIPAPDANEGTQVSARQALRSSLYIRLLIAAALVAMMTNAIIVNMVPILRSQGINAGAAAAVAGLIGIGSIAGRLIGGILLDRAPAHLVAAGAVAMPVIACLMLVFLPGSLWASALAVLLLGLAVGIEFDAVAYLVAQHFGMSSYGTLFGTIVGALVLATGLGPFFANLIYDQVQSYLPALYACIPACILASSLFLTLDGKRRPTPIHLDAPNPTGTNP